MSSSGQTAARERTGQRQARAPNGLRLDVVHDAGDWTAIADAEGFALAAADAVAKHSGRLESNAEACLAMSDDAHVRELNRNYRGQDKPTNVLSFPAPDAPSGSGAARRLGDVILAVESVLREASELGIPAHHHLQHLVVHGLLHLLGCDHESDADAEAMEALEIRILATMGLPDPYAIADRLTTD